MKLKVLFCLCVNTEMISSLKFHTCGLQRDSTEKVVVQPQVLGHHGVGWLNTAWHNCDWLYNLTNKQNWLVEIILSQYQVYVFFNHSVFVLCASMHVLFKILSWLCISDVSVGGCYLWKHTYTKWMTTPYCNALQQVVPWTFLVIFLSWIPCKQVVDILWILKCILVLSILSRLNKNMV